MTHGSMQATVLLDRVKIIDSLSLVAPVLLLNVDPINLISVSGT